MRLRRKKEHKKPKTAAEKGKRYRCCICRKKAARKVTIVPHYCEQHRHLNPAQADFNNQLATVTSDDLSFD